jgi:hypothetical protein
MTTVSAHRSVTNFKELQFKDIACYFDKPLAHAASSLGVSVTYLKRLCRSFQIAKWPYRRMSSLKSKRRILLERVGKREAVQHLEMIEEIDREMDRIYQTGARDDDSTAFGRGVRKLSVKTEKELASDEVGKYNFVFHESYPLQPKDLPLNLRLDVVNMMQELNASYSARNSIFSWQEECY